MSYFSFHHSFHECDDCPECTKNKKQARMKWTEELHLRFRDSVKRLGPKATPSRIQKEMQVPALTLRQISSHLQKYKIEKAITANSKLASSLNKEENLKRKNEEDLVDIPSDDEPPNKRPSVVKFALPSSPADTPSPNSSFSSSLASLSLSSSCSSLSLDLPSSPYDASPSSSPFSLSSLSLSCNNCNNCNNCSYQSPPYIKSEYGPRVKSEYDTYDTALTLSPTPSPSSAPSTTTPVVTPRSQVQFHKLPNEQNEKNEKKVFIQEESPMKFNTIAFNVHSDEFYQSMNELVDLLYTQ